MDDDSVFVDANILIYATFSGPFHGLARERLQELADTGVILWTSRQVLREFLAVATRPGNIVPQPSPLLLAEAVRRFESGIRIAEEDSAITEILLVIVTSLNIQGKQVHDANIAATMRRYGIRRLLTHNAVDFRRYAPDLDVIPLIP